MKAFFDTNVLVYAQIEDQRKARAVELIERGGAISVQVLNEFASVMHRKMSKRWGEISEALTDFLVVFGPIRPLTVQTHASALALARDHGFSFYDALIVAAAIEADCDTLFTEDMQHGRAIGTLTILNPFR